MDYPFRKKQKKSIIKVFKKKYKNYGAGRTDKEFMLWQFANFKLNEKIKDTNKFLSE